MPTQLCTPDVFPDTPFRIGQVVKSLDEDTFYVIEDFIFSLKDNSWMVRYHNFKKPNKVFTDLLDYFNDLFKIAEG